MAEYIEREAVIEFGEQQLKRLDDGEAYRRLDFWLNSIPAADVRPVVLCKDCVHRYVRDWPSCQGRRGDFFCADGKKREES